MPDKAIGLVAGSLAGVVHALFFSQLAQEGMPQDMRRDLDVLLLWAVGIGLAGDALNDMAGIAAGE